MNMISIKTAFRFALINFIFMNITVFGAWRNASNIYKLKIKIAENTYQSMELYRNKALLIFNFPTYVQKSKYFDYMLEIGKYVNNEFCILAFKSNCFQTDKEHKNKVSPKQLEKQNIIVYKCYIISKNGNEIWKYLKLKTKPDTDHGEGMEIQGDYTMFIVDKSGMPVYRFEPGTDIMEVIDKLNEQLVVKIPWENTTDDASSFPSDEQLEKKVPLKKKNTAGGASSSKKIKLLGTTINIEE